MLAPARLDRRSSVWLLLTLLACALPGLGCDNNASQAASPVTEEADADSPAEKAIDVDVGEVRAEPLSALYSTSATLRAESIAPVTARTQGVIEKLLVEEGDEVEEGQPLAILEDDEQKIQVERTVAIRDIRQKELERSTSLTERGVLSDNELEVVRREAEEAKHAAALAELNLARTVIRAPFSGRILDRYLDVGATVQNGTEVYRLADLDPLYADVNVPERSVGRLSPGQTVRLFGDSEDARFSATIERIAPAVNPATGTVKVTLTVAGGEGLRPGSFVRVSVVTDTHDEALVLPRSALVAEGRRWNLFRLDPSGETVELLEVELGFEEGERVEIGGVVTEGKTLSVGDPVVTKGASALSDGARVRVIDP